jgi:hypothetical protein
MYNVPGNARRIPEQDGHRVLFYFDKLCQIRARPPRAAPSRTGELVLKFQPMKQVGILGALAMVVFVSCGGEGDGKIDTMEECKEVGGRVVPGTGPGPMCEPHEEQIGSIPGTYEGIICCRDK